MSTRRTVVVFCPGGGHAQRLLPLIAGLAKRRIDVHVMTRAEMRHDVEAAGGAFHDLFARYPVDAVDSESIPLPSRLVTFAAAYAEPLTADVARLRPDLLVYDSFMVIAPLIGRRLGIPYVGMRAGHAQVPAQAITELQSDPRIATSPACHAAVATLRAEYDVVDASPFSYLQGVSPHLNLYPEPARFLDEEIRGAFEPMAFFGSLAPDIREASSRQRLFSDKNGGACVYVSFGTAIWRYYAREALAAMAVLADVFSTRDVEVLTSLGRFTADDATLREIERPNVRVEPFVDQWGALRDADLFVTHHGLNSTHEAVFHQVPMLSYPFFGDQPAMARCCRDLGLALPLSTTPRAPLDVATVQRQLDAMLDEREALASRLVEARIWELDTIEGREAIFDRMLALS